MTLIEVMIVLAILGLAMGAMAYGLRKVRKTDVRQDGARLRAALQSTFDRAASSGAHHRMIIDLENETFRAERCEGKIKVRRSIDAAQDAKDAEIEAQQLKIRQDLEAAAQAQAQAAAQAGPAGALGGLMPPAPPPTMPVGGAACTPVKGELGKPQPLKVKRGVSFRKVFVAHSEAPVEGGEAMIHFFPLGYAERADVELTDPDGNVFSVLVHPLSGKVELLDHPLDRPEEFVGRDATGQSEEDQ